MSDTARPLKRKYARVERERRFLLERLPTELDAAAFHRIRDRFLEGTNLRLRRVEMPDGSHLVTKLGQKLLDPEAAQSSRNRLMTT
ncbi:MAG: hypothetical protein KC561_07135, partial [Myxococcales bacterium]|nr:hypothetical protein [Myxococcales bacterium]